MRRVLGRVECIATESCLEQAPEYSLIIHIYQLVIKNRIICIMELRSVGTTAKVADVGQQRARDDLDDLS